jgi:hypothetical protein
MSNRLRDEWGLKVAKPFVALHPEQNTPQHYYSIVTILTPLVV